MQYMEDKKSPSAGRPFCCNMWKECQNKQKMVKDSIDTMSKRPHCSNTPIVSFEKQKGWI